MGKKIDPFVQAQKLANQSAVKIQKLANKSALQIQKLSSQTTEKTFKFNREEAATARDWQKQMSDTSHQREVKDLIAAGLNPVLSSNSGAQSYTTSSASGQAADPSGAVANLYGSAMSSAATRYTAGMSFAGQRYSADQSAAAQLKASRQQAAAARYAAQQAAAASRYAADRNAEVQKYKTDKDFEARKYQVENQRPNSIVGLFDKMAEKFGIYGGAKNQLDTQAKNLAKAKKDPSFRIDKNKPFTYSNISDSMKQNRLDPMLKNLGVTQNDVNRRILFNAVYNDNQTALKTLQNWYEAKYSKPKTSTERSLFRYWEHH